MAKVFFNLNIEEKKGMIWSAKNGATRRTLCLIVNEKDFPKGINVNEGESIIGKLGYLDKGNHSFIFVNKSNKGDNIFGVFCNISYGYKVLNPETEVYTASSVGGYGNSESKFGIYKEGAVIKIYTYKNRHSPSYAILTGKGWLEYSTEEVVGVENEYTKKIMELSNIEIEEIE